MKLILALAASSVTAYVAPVAPRAATRVSETKADLEALATNLNPIVGYWDPLNVADTVDGAFYGFDNAGAIAWWRQAEIKHAVAMAPLRESVPPHYMKGGQPGKFRPSPRPTRRAAASPPVPFDLYDPFGFSKNRSPEAKARGLLVEINNGRAAMLGIFGFLAESKVSGSVPVLTGLGIPHYDGDYMAPFAANFHIGA
ncbi:chlorophyll A-B binding protein [Aureococcus anophagefferens]|nr:chlorophyll A-B binding protein [Aureococcus anophagefferens]